MKNAFQFLNLSDKFTLVYMILNIVYISFGYNRIQEPLPILLIFISLCVVLVYLSFQDHELKDKESRFVKRLVRFLHLWFNPIMFAYFFEATSKVNHVIFYSFLDPIFQRWDFRIFGYQPAMQWGKMWDTYLIQEVLHFSYFAYYLMILCVPLYFYMKKDEEIFKRIIFNISFVFFGCYFIYMFLPVAGGRALEGAFDLTIQYRYGLFTHIMALIYRSTTHMGGAFPSSHVAIALTISMISAKFMKVLPFILFPITFLLAIATVYCHYHYFVDVLSGVIYGVLMYCLSENIYKKVKNI